MMRVDHGFVDHQLNKIYAVSCRAEGVALQRKAVPYAYLPELDAAISDVVAHCAARRGFRKEDLLRGVRGKLRLQATILESFNPIVPFSHLSPNHIKRAEVLRKAVELIDGHLAETSNPKEAA